MPEKDESKQTSNQQKGNGRGVWGKKRGALKTQSNAGELKKDMLLMLIKGGDAAKLPRAGL